MTTAPHDRPDAPPPALAGIRVLDVSTLFAGPYAAQLLADFGADVIKVEHPSGDPLRRYGPVHRGVPLAWKLVNRNKRGIVLDLKDTEDAARLLELVAQADVVIENFRPGTLESWGLGPDVLQERNPQLIITRVTGFGQDGPYANRPGFGTLAEAMSGLAAMSGMPDGPPQLPAFPLADAFAGVQAACATLIALHARGSIGSGQVVDVSIVETMVGALGPQLTVYDALGVKPERVGNVSRYSAPRNIYPCADGRWVAVSAPAQSVAERVVRLVGRGELAGEPWFASGVGRAEHRALLDDAVGQWIAVRDRAEVLDAFASAGAAVAPIYEVDDVLADPHFQAREVTVRIPDAELEDILLPNVPFRPTGPRLGQHSAEVFGEERERREP